MNIKKWSSLKAIKDILKHSNIQYNRKTLNEKGGSEGLKN